MNKPAPKILSVAHTERLTPNMHRIVLYGENLDNTLIWYPGCYVKLVLPDEETGQLILDRMPRPKVRTYTARFHDPKSKTLTVDFAIHQPAGPATRWALNAKVGDPVGLVGPGPLKMDPSKGDWYLFAADMAAMPAAISVMESLHESAKGYAFLEVTDAQDIQDLIIPSNIEVTWLIHPDAHVKSQQQLDAIKALSYPEGTPNIFVAGELGTIREIKNYILNDWNPSDGFLYISSYWKIGLKEEEHKQAKRSMA